LYVISIVKIIMQFPHWLFAVVWKLHTLYYVVTFSVVCFNASVSLLDGTIRIRSVKYDTGTRLYVVRHNEGLGGFRPSGTCIFQYSVPISVIVLLNVYKAAVFKVNYTVAWFDCNLTSSL